MIRKLVVLFALVTATVAFAKTYNVTLFEPSIIAGKELKPGQYRLEVKTTNVVITSGKLSVEAPVKVENTGKKVDTTSVRYSNAEGKYVIQEILLGGTNTKLVFNP